MLKRSRLPDSSSSKKKRGPYRKHQPQRLSVASVLKSFLASRKSYQKAERAWLKRYKAAESLENEENELMSRLKKYEDKVKEIKENLEIMRENHDGIRREVKELRHDLDQVETAFFQSKRVVEEMGYADWDDEAIKSLIEENKVAEEVMPLSKNRARVTKTIFTQLDADKDRARAIGYKQDWKLNRCFLLSTLEPVPREGVEEDKYAVMKSFCDDMRERGALAAFDYPVENWLYFGTPDLAYYLGPACTEEHFVELAKYDDLEFMMRLALPTKEPRLLKMQDGAYLTTAWKMLVAAATSLDCSYRVFSYLMDYFLDRRACEYAINVSALFAHWVRGFSVLGWTRLPKTDLQWFSVPSQLDRFKHVPIPGNLFDIKVLKFDNLNSRNTGFETPTAPWCYQHVRSVPRTRFSFQKGEIKDTETQPVDEDHWKKLFFNVEEANAARAYRPKTSAQLMQDSDDYWLSKQGQKMLRTMMENNIQVSQRLKDLAAKGKELEEKAKAASSSSPPHSDSGEDVEMKPADAHAPAPAPVSSSSSSSAAPAPAQAPAPVETIDLSSSSDEEDEEEEKGDGDRKMATTARVVRSKDPIMSKDLLFSDDVRGDPTLPARVNLGATIRVGSNHSQYRFLNQASKLFAFLDCIGYTGVLAIDPRLDWAEYKYVPRGDPKVQVSKVAQDPVAIHLAKTVIASVLGVSDAAWWSDADSFTATKYAADTAAENAAGPDSA